MSRYELSPDKIRALAPKTAAEQAVHRFILDVEARRTPDEQTLQLVSQVLSRAISLGGDCVDQAFRLQVVGRPTDNGPAPAVVLSAFIELQLRELGKEKRGALARAQREAIEQFGLEDKDPQQTVMRYWIEGRGKVETLPDADLRKIFDPLG